MDKKRNSTTLSIWMLTCFVGAILMGFLSYYKWSKFSDAFAVFIFYLPIGCLFSFYVYPILRILFKKIESKKLTSAYRITWLVIIAICLTLLSFSPVFYFFISGSLRLRYDLYNLFICIIPFYLFSSVTITVLVGESYFRKIKELNPQFPLSSLKRKHSL